MAKASRFVTDWSSLEAFLKGENFGDGWARVVVLDTLHGQFTATLRPRRVDRIHATPPQMEAGDV